MRAFRKESTLFAFRTFSTSVLFLPAKKPIHTDSQNLGQCHQFLVRNRTLLPLQQGQSRNTDLNTRYLQFGQQFHLLHILTQSGLCYTGTDDVLVTKFKLACFQMITLLLPKLYAVRDLTNLVIPNIIKFGEIKFIKRR